MSSSRSCSRLPRTSVDLLSHALELCAVLGLEAAELGRVPVALPGQGRALAVERRGQLERALTLRGQPAHEDGARGSGADDQTQ